MINYGLVYDTLTDVSGYHSAEAINTAYQDKQKQRFKRIAQIAQLFMNDVKKKKDSITDGNIPIGLSLDEVVEQLKTPKSTIMRDIHAFKASFDRYLENRTRHHGLVVVFELKDYKLQGHRPIR